MFFEKDQLKATKRLWEQNMDLTAYVIYRSYAPNTLVKGLDFFVGEKSTAPSNAYQDTSARLYEPSEKQFTRQTEWQTGFA